MNPATTWNLLAVGATVTVVGALFSETFVQYSSLAIGTVLFFLAGCHGRFR